MSLIKGSRRGFLWAGGFGVLGAFAFRGIAQSHQTARSRPLYVGTYTSGKSEGIYLYSMDMSSGELKYSKSVKRVVDPSFLAIGRTRRFLYAVNELSEFAGKPGGAVSAFSIDQKTGNLSLLNQQTSLGGAPCYVTVDATGKFVLVANYTGGNVSVLPVLRDGSLGAATAMVQHEGSGPNKERQEAPHAHCVVLDHSNRFAFVADLGLDKIVIYRFDAKGGKLIPAAQPFAQLKSGSGPRHFVFHPNGRYAYVINELDSTLTGFSYDAARGNLRSMQTISALPKDFSGKNYCADLHISPSGKFIYGSNRGHNSIVVFAIKAKTCELTHLEHVSTQGKTPRNFTIDPTGRFLLVANQESDSVVTMRIDPVTGRLKPTGHSAEVPTPVCLKFL